MPEPIRKKRGLKGEALLRERLLPVQFEDYKKTGAFNVRGKGGRLWRIYGDRTNRSCVKTDGYARNVWALGTDASWDRDPALHAYMLMTLVKSHTDQDIGVIACQAGKQYNDPEPHNYGGAI